ncbi:OmpA family protein [Streptomyces sp. XM4193]|uniref:OmpA family protein n=1 Tax=Streptomyces sp. XM4193 TaxID=2929782 RepID=UPI001FF74C11|nr:OmpA family protein [Streptomyces sp. XM4193]MCK1795740.1 OmpA family protein [Streptomyces sp. XM4193]
MVLTLNGAPSAAAEDSPYGPANDKPPVEIDANSPKLMMRDGATLDKARVIDIVQVVEEGGGVGGGNPTPSPTPTPSDTPSPEDSTTPPPTEDDDEDESGSGVAEERREETNEQTKFTLQAEVLFGKNSSKLNKKANARIADIAAEINKQKASEVSVYGFTDNLGSYENGKRLSQERAEAVHKVLVKSLKDSSLKFNIRGYSEDFPIADNSTEDGRAQNRRVEISFQRAD